MLEISYKYLNQLDCAEYRKYRALKSKKFDGESTLWMLGILFHVTLASLIGGISSLYSPQWYGWFLFYLLGYPITLGVSFGLGMVLDEVFGIQKYLAAYEKRSQQYKYFQELRRRFLSIEMEIEDQVKEYNEKGLPELIQLIDKNTDNQEFFKNLVEILWANHTFVERASETVKEFNQRNQYRKKLSFSRILNHRGELIFTRWNKTKNPVPQTIPGSWTYRLRQKIKAPSSKQRSSITTLGDIKTEAKPISRPLNSPPKIIPSGITPKITISLKNESSSKSKIPSEDRNLVTESEIPKKKVRRSSTVQTIKASEKFWEELGSKRIKIGKKGEMLVMEYERKRISKDYGKLFLSYLDYSAVNEGDGLGYDITSFSDGRKIYIEVKTTTGNFWDGLIFTKNELKAMRELGENYFLYRVFHFDINSNFGKLKIFKGRESIEAEFNFNPQTFLLVPKN